MQAGDDGGADMRAGQEQERWVGNKVEEKSRRYIDRRKKGSIMVVESERPWQQALLWRIKG